MKGGVGVKLQKLGDRGFGLRFRVKSVASVYG